MRVRVKTTENHAIWYVEVDDAAAKDTTLLRAQVARALKNQYARLDDLEVRSRAGDTLLIVNPRRRPKHWWSIGA
ncbi:MAG: hypothetical protein HYY93_12860 [Planctomycetes bacterium]|nr:hypothetical protein [Planctomycetota bacterium]